MELWECATGVGTWIYRGMETRSSGRMLQARGRGGGEEVWRCAAGVGSKAHP